MLVCTPVFLDMCVCISKNIRLIGPLVSDISCGQTNEQTHRTKPNIPSTAPPSEDDKTQYYKNNFVKINEETENIYVTQANKCVNASCNR